MKKTLSVVLALMMLICAIPFTAFADQPMANSLKVTNAKDGVCSSTVELSWTPSTKVNAYDYHIYITKSYDGREFTTEAEITNSVDKTTTYTYSTKAEDYGKTVTFGVQYEMGSTLHENYRSTVSVKVEKAAASYDEAACKQQMLQGLADPSFTKKTEKYDGKKFVKGTKSVWSCKLYTLTAEATKVIGSKVTFKITFKSNIAAGYIGEHGYSINIGSKTFYPEDTITYTVDTSKTDSSDYSAAAGGPQFFIIRVEREQKFDDVIYSSQTSYFNDIVKNREVYPSNANSFTRAYISDTYALSYSVKNDFALNPDIFVVKDKSITLGTYPFASTVQYRASGTKSWKKKSFGKNKKITISGLKANKAYEIKVLCKISYTDPETGKDATATEQVGKTLKITTVIKSKPQVTSVKISKIKYGTKKIDGYWESDGDWHPSEKLNTAKYTATVKVKKVPKNAKGLVMKIGGATYYAKGSKGTFTFKNMTYQDTKKLKGKKFTAKFSYASNIINKSPVGIGPAKSVTYKLKKGTTKVK